MKRIQMKRIKGWKMPRNSVYVGRPSRWGNKYKVGVDGTATQCVEKFREWALHCQEFFFDARHELSGKDLVCWCALNKPCHADVLLDIANS